MLNGYEYLLVALAAMAAGAVNALAGGGTLITFPIADLCGRPTHRGECDQHGGFMPWLPGRDAAQSKDLRGQRRRLWMFLPAGATGGIIGGILLLNTGERLFSELVPYLILLASGLLAIQDPLRAWLNRRQSEREQPKPLSEKWAILPVGMAAVYGGYFGAGLSVIILAVLALLLEDTLTRLNALKQAIAFSANVAAAIFFVFSGKVVWEAALVMAIGALAGGAMGGRLAGRIQPSLLRKLVVAIGVIVAVVYLLR